MFCTSCGTELKDQDRFCPNAEPECASRKTPDRSPPSYRNKLSRPMDQKKIAGVCAGFARYFEMDVTLVRIIFILLAFWPPSIGLIGYIVAWIAMPKDPLLIQAPSPAHQGA